MYEYAIIELQTIRNYIKYNLYAKSKMSKDTKAKVKDFEEVIDLLKHLELTIKGKVEAVDSWSYINDVNLDCLIGDKYDGKKIEIYVREVK